MLIRILLTIAFALTLTACGGDNQSKTKVPTETMKDFTTSAPQSNQTPKPAPAIPGKAQLPGAPITGESTQESEKYVQPKPVTPSGPAAAPAATTPADTTPADTTPAATTPAATTPAGTTPADTTPAATTPADTTPAATTPSS